MRTGSWTGPPRGKKAPRVGISSTALDAISGRFFPEAGLSMAGLSILRSYYSPAQTGPPRDVQARLGRAPPHWECNGGTGLQQHRRGPQFGPAGGVWGLEQLLSRNVKRFQGVLVFKAHRILYHSTLGLRVIKREREHRRGPHCGPALFFVFFCFRVLGLGFGVWGLVRFRVEGWCRVWGLGMRDCGVGLVGDEGLGFRVWGLGIGVWGLWGIRVQELWFVDWDWGFGTRV